MFMASLVMRFIYFRFSHFRRFEVTTSFHLLRSVLLFPDVSRRGLLKWVRPSVRSRVRLSVDTMKLVACGRNSSCSFIPIQMFLSWAEGVHVVLGLSYFLSTLSIFST